MEPQSQTSTIKKRLIMIGVAMALLLTVWWLYGHSYVTIKLDHPPGSGQITYRLVNQTSNKTTIITTSSAKVTKLVPRASYEITVSQAEQSSFTVIKTKPFLLKITVDSNLAPQPARRFVGYNPEGCMYYLDTILYSYNCIGATSRTTHVPATATTPTYNLKDIGGSFGSVEGIVNTSGGLVALFQSNSTPHIAYLLTDTVKASQGVALKDLDPNKVYKLASYQKGFIVYDSTFRDIRYYESVHATPQAISITRPTDKSQQPQFLSTSNDSIAAAYSDKANFQENSDPTAIGKVKDDVFLYKDGKTKEFTFDAQYSAVTPCGLDKLCLVEAVSKHLSVYDVSIKLKLIYAVDGVNGVQEAGQNLLAVRQNDILNLDVNSNGGSVAYTFDSYRYCGLQNDGDNYLLCVTDSNAKNIVLHLTPLVADTDAIDKKVAELQKMPEVTTVSAYGSYIFISPAAGSLVYDQATSSFGYNPAIVKAANAKIDAKITSLGIDRSKYTIIYTIH